MANAHSEAPLLALGTISVVLGSIALMLFFLPILSIPIAICGALLGSAGVIRSAASLRKSVTAHTSSELRWAAVGCFVCCAVMLLGFAIAYAPLGETARMTVPSPDWSAPAHPYVPPPAPPR